MKRLRFVALTACLIGVSRVAEASLIGDTVDCAIAPAAAYACTPTSAVVGAGTEFSISAGALQLWSVDIADYSVTVNFVFPGGFAAASGEYLTLSSLFGPTEIITGYSLSTSGSVINLSASDITTGAHSLGIDLQLTGWGTGGSATITLETAPVATAVPEPASMLLLGTGLLTAGVRRWGQRRA